MSEITITIKVDGHEATIAEPTERPTIPIPNGEPELQGALKEVLRLEDILEHNRVVVLHRLAKTLFDGLVVVSDEWRQPS